MLVNVYIYEMKMYYEMKHNDLYILQEVKDIYLFGIVGVLILVDIVLLIPPTSISSAILRRKQKEFEGMKVSFV